ncbi:hypothetical protein KDL01_28030 [Actinospica durhamensis]|uniref:DUF5709 domain-containing protein n=1 Tax=Actinospica durhamensis TaxID=1508375 RepID=A0A941ETW7_9ACTN|nr:DUF5709 domain-containing protein [Actinospica durhamensis]MBR7837158.1 hypothetical protein [Actinospica durhamensis]
MSEQDHPSAADPETPVGSDPGPAADPGYPSDDVSIDGAQPGLETQDVPEDEGVLQPGDTLLTDDLESDPLDTGISPPERRPAAERFGVTDAEAREGESLEDRMAQEQPEIPAVAPEDQAQPRTGRLVAADEGTHPVEEGEPRQFAQDVGRDGEAASAEEAAVHLVPEDEVGGDEDEDA